MTRGGCRAALGRAGVAGVNMRAAGNCSYLAGSVPVMDPVSTRQPAPVGDESQSHLAGR